MRSYVFLIILEFAISLDEQLLSTKWRPGNLINHGAPDLCGSFLITENHHENPHDTTTLMPHPPSCHFFIVWRHRFQIISQCQIPGYIIIAFTDSSSSLYAQTSDPIHAAR